MAPPVATSDHLQDLAALVGPAAVRAAGAADAIDQVQPAIVAEPDTAAGVAAVLAWASARRVRTVVRGGGTRLSWGRIPEPFALVLSTRRLGRILRHEPGDLTVSVEAGMPLADLNRELATQGQSLPLDVPSDASTIGGLLAVNDSGPQRHRHGAPRDLLIGIHLATTDGRLVKAGGNVVKNVAGYDLGRLMCGSFGSLAAIVSATFKLAPVPADALSLIGDFSSAAALGRATAAIAGSQLDPLCVDVHVRPGRTGVSCRLLLRFAGIAAVNEAQVAEARRLIAPGQPDRLDILSEDREIPLWREQSRGLWASTGTLVKLSWLPASLPAVVDLVEEVAQTHSLALDLCARGAAGSGLIHMAGAPRAQAAAIGQLRERADVVSHVVIARADRSVKALVDVWGPDAETMPLLKRIKDTLDPAGILNASRGPMSSARS